MLPPGCASRRRQESPLIAPGQSMRQFWHKLEIENFDILEIENLTNIDIPPSISSFRRPEIQNREFKGSQVDFETKSKIEIFAPEIQNRLDFRASFEFETDPEIENLTFTPPTRI